MNDQNNAPHPLYGTEVDPYAPSYRPGTSTIHLDGKVYQRSNETGGTVKIHRTAPEVPSGARIASAMGGMGSGMRSGADITPDDRIKIAGMDVTIKDAMNAGLVIREQDGSFRLVGGQKKMKA